jgi:hypothetical protein
MKSASSMMRLRMFIGLTSALHGLGALKFSDQDSGVAWLVREARDGWMFAAALLAGGLLMAYAAAREWGGERRRRCRVVSSFTLAVTWIAVFFNSVTGGWDTVTCLAPAYVFFCFWAWLGEATVHRRSAIQEG